MKYLRNTTILLTFCAMVLNQAGAHWTSKRPDGHAPIGVMAEHKHGKGEWMASYRYMVMNMNTLQTNGLSTSGYSMLPTEMNMDMHMFGAMYAQTDNWTWMFMANYLDNEMEMKSTGMMAMTSTMRTKGWGDLSLSGLFEINSWDEEVLLGSIGIGIPTGSIDEKNGSTNQPYGMQLGSDTLDIRPGLTYLGQSETYSWGAQVSAVLRTGTNDNSYSLGDNWAATGWLSRKFSNSLSASIRFTGERLGTIDGIDPNVGMATMSPTNNAAFSGGDILSGSVGVNYLFGNGHRLAFEYQIPLDQDLDGIQMERDNTLTLGWQYAW